MDASMATIKVQGTCRVSSIEAAARLDAQTGGTGYYGGLPIEVEGLGLYRDLKQQLLISQSTSHKTGHTTKDNERPFGSPPPRRSFSMKNLPTNGPAPDETPRPLALVSCSSFISDAGSTASTKSADSIISLKKKLPKTNPKSPKSPRPKNVAQGLNSKANHSFHKAPKPSITTTSTTTTTCNTTANGDGSEASKTTTTVTRTSTSLANLSQATAMDLLQLINSGFTSPNPAASVTKPAVPADSLAASIPHPSMPAAKPAAPIEKPVIPVPSPAIPTPNLPALVAKPAMSADRLAPPFPGPLMPAPTPAAPVSQPPPHTPVVEPKPYPTPQSRLIITEPKMISQKTQMSETYLVSTLADAEALSKTGYFKGLPIEVKGLGLYLDILGYANSGYKCQSGQDPSQQPSNGSVVPAAPTPRNIQPTNRRNSMDAANGGSVPPAEPRKPSSADFPTPPHLRSPIKNRRPSVDNLKFDSIDGNGKVQPISAKPLAAPTPRPNQDRRNSMDAANGGSVPPAEPRKPSSADFPTPPHLRSPIKNRRPSMDNLKLDVIDGNGKTQLFFAKPLAASPPKPNQAATPKNPEDPPAKCPERPLFHQSIFKAHYDVAKAPEYPHQLLEAVHCLLVKYAALKGIEKVNAENFFKDIQETAFNHVKELLSDIQCAAARIWTSPKRMEGKEFCFILNEAIRDDIPELMPYVVTITRAINLLLVSGRMIELLEVTRVYRGGGLPDVHRSFFTPNKTYRVPMFLATSVDRDTSLKKFCRRAELKAKLPPVLWIIHVDEKDGCKHVNYLHMSECLEEQEYLFSPYSVFTVLRADWKDHPAWTDPHVVHLLAAHDNRRASEALPVAPWA